MWYIKIKKKGGIIMGKISKKLFNKFIDGQPLFLTLDDFISNGHWAIRKDVLNNALNGINYKINEERYIKIVDILTQDFILGKTFSDGLITKIEKEIFYYDNIKFREHTEYGKQFLIIDNIEKLKNHGINKLYYSVIQKIVGRGVKARVLLVNYIFYCKKNCWNSEIAKIEKNDFIYFIWTKNNTDNLSDLLAVCTLYYFN
jgi:hypothetical protein